MIRLKDNLCRKFWGVETPLEKVPEWVFSNEWETVRGDVELEDDVVIGEGENEDVIMVITIGDDGYNVYFQYRGKWWRVDVAGPDEEDSTEVNENAIDLYLMVRDNKLPLKFWVLDESAEVRV